MKKLVAIAGAGAMLLAVVTPALAHEEHSKPVPQTTLTNMAFITNASSAVSSTGGNSQVGGGYMWTGNAGAESTGVVIANTTVSADCHCLPNKISNGAFITNGSSAGSYTGDNTQKVTAPKVERHERHDKSVDPSLTLFTGDAGTKVNAWSVVNTTVSF